MDQFADSNGMVKRRSSCGWSILTAVKMSWKHCKLISFMKTRDIHTVFSLLSPFPGCLFFRPLLRGGGGGEGLLEGELI